MNNRVIWKFVLYSVIIMLIFPVITNWLMFVGSFEVAGDKNTWIGYLGSFWGAIIGGVISGAITLLGVRMTIKDAEKVRQKDEYPKKINNLEILIHQLENNQKVINKHMRLKDPFNDENQSYLRLHYINQYLQITPNKEMEALVDDFLISIKENVIEIDAIWYKDYFLLRDKIKNLRGSFSLENQQLNDLFEEAQDYFNEHYEPLTSYLDYAENHQKERYEKIYKEIVNREQYLIDEIYESFAEYHHKAELYQLKLLKDIE
ncbi:hypothetical protein ACIQWI_21560 [Peribacillus frigoritolerans]